MAKEISFIYHPNTEKEIDEEKVREVQSIIASFLVKKAIKKVSESS